MKANKHSAGEITWRSPANIALVKYWGKQGMQLPSNPSLSFTLQHATAETKLNYAFSEDGLKVNFTFGGKVNKAFADRVESYIHNLLARYPWLDRLELRIDSQNNFPHSAGIASSAAGMSSLALCLNTMIYNLGGKNLKAPGFLQESSKLARLASGSACRSVYGGYTTWGKIRTMDETSDLYSSPIPYKVHKDFSDIRDAILIVHSGLKPISSGQGHGLMKAHPFAKARFKQANAHVISMIETLQSGDWERFIGITELEALTLHGLIMSSNPGYIFLKPESINVLNKIREFREQSHLPLCFTIDAGPNVHLIYPGFSQSKVETFIKDELLHNCQDKQWIKDGIGKGPELMQNSFV